MKVNIKILRKENIVSIVENIYYSGESGAARKFAKEMISSGTVDAIRNEAGNNKYDYFFPLDDEHFRESFEKMIHMAMDKEK